jgi:hypothetical protein
MLTYATVFDFSQAKDLGRAGIVTIPAAAYTKIDDYLMRATRYIDRQTRRKFYPWRETRTYPIPYNYYDLSIRQYPSAELALDQDLLETLTVNNGQQDIPSDGYFLLETNIYPKTLIALKWPYYWGGPYGAVPGLYRYNQPILSVTGVWGYADGRYPGEWWINTYEAVPVGGITANQTTITVTDADGLDAWGTPRFQDGYMIRINNEFMEVTGVNTSTNVITVLRGVNDTVPAAHNEAIQIKRWRVLEDIKDACIKIAKTWLEADIAAGGRIGVSDTSTGAELTIPSDPLAIINSYVRSSLLD